VSGNDDLGDTPCLRARHCPGFPVEQGEETADPGEVSAADRDVMKYFYFSSML
jgi:hypothetical protein